MIGSCGLNSLSAEEGDWDYSVSSCVIKTVPSARLAVFFFFFLLTAIVSGKGRHIVPFFHK